MGAWTWKTEERETDQNLHGSAKKWSWFEEWRANEDHGGWIRMEKKKPPVVKGVWDCSK